MAARLALIAAGYVGASVGFMFFVAWVLGGCNRDAEAREAMAEEHQHRH
jgi:hypothetical protein